jgi:hypothetical protein
MEEKQSVVYRTTYLVVEGGDRLGYGLRRIEKQW